VDLAAHNNPDLSILQIGHSDALVNSILSVLGEKTVRCSKYTVLDLDLDHVTDEFRQRSDIVSFGLLEVESLGEHSTWAENHLNIVIVDSDLITAEQVQRLKTFLRPEGMMIIRNSNLEDSDR
jgi:hypothetical protein